ncbi:MAG: type II toxin-antitoxin system VapC family toxin [Terriglobia bacterium]
MSWIVLDASVTLSWCFPDEQTPAAMGVLDLLKAGDQALVPAFWCSEVLNSLLAGERKGRISADQTQAFLEDLRALRPTLDDVSLERVIHDIQALCRQYALASCDALYVELAMRSGSPLATLDKNQRDAALAVGVTCL